MKTVNLKEHPFYLKEDGIKWVKKTIKNMTIEEKIGQLFFPMGFTTKEKELEEIVSKYKVGGMMYRSAKAKKVQKAHRFIQSKAKIPLFLAANLEAGGNGIIDEGTFFGNNMEVGATFNKKQGTKLGHISTLEGKMVGCNMAFAPVIDINMNFRNPVTNTRSYGDDVDNVAQMGSAYVKAAINNNVATTIKHFPGDGVDSRDHHLVTTINSLDKDTWMKTFGKVYKESIQAGARGLMVGHITLPGYFEKGKTGYEHKDTPASLNPVLLNKLLREELNYKGLTMTDATLMTGFGSYGKRKDLVPQAIQAGCDMFLFNRNLGEEYQFMLDGYHNGVITEERLEEALTRILGLKAALNLQNRSLEELVPSTLDYSVLEKHKKDAINLSKESISLIKDNDKLLPLNPNKTKKVGVIYFGNKPMQEIIFGNMPGFKGFLLRTIMKFNKKKSATEKFVASLNKKGFEAFEYSFGDIFKIMNDNKRPLEEWKKQFDFIIVLSKIETASNLTSLQVTYKAMGFDAPWFAKEIPTMLVSIANPYQSFDFEMIHTVVNAYSPKDVMYDVLVDKLTGKEKFNTKSPVQFNFEEVDFRKFYQ